MLLKEMKIREGLLILALTLFVGCLEIYGQADIMAWGNITGIHTPERFFEIQTDLRVYKKGWLGFTATAKEEQRPKFKRNGSTAEIKTQLESFTLVESIEDVAPGEVLVTVEAEKDSITMKEGLFFCVEFPVELYPDIKIDLGENAEKRNFEVPTDRKKWREWSRNRYEPIPTKQVIINSKTAQLVISSQDTSEVIVLKGFPRWGNPNTLILLRVASGEGEAGTKISKKFRIKITGERDENSARLVVDSQNPKQVFDGIGGNFRLQNPLHDPQVIDYCLENLNVAWSRVEMPWSLWHRDEDSDPLKVAESGYINDRVIKSMEMAQRLTLMDIPVVVSCWSAPEWATTGERSRGRKDDGTFGNPLNQDKTRVIVKSIVSYLVYLKREFGTEAAFFSFNESDLGINVRQTGEEHAKLIKDLGKAFAEADLGTRLLLGDNSDATTYSFTKPALNDSEALPHIGAVSFHSWRGCNDLTLTAWRDIADEANVPLIIGEGSLDAAAHQYPEIFLEFSYALREINQYVRILSICRPLTILQWQLTSDYSVMTGDGIYKTSGKMKPTQRFWILKQLGLTPQGSFHFPAKIDHEHISAAALGHIAKGIFTVHIVNQGAAREVMVEGLPDKVKSMKIYITDQNRNMASGKSVKVHNGKTTILIPSASYITLINDPGN